MRILAVDLDNEIDKALVFNPQERLSAEELLKEPFLSVTTSLKTLKPNIDAARKRKEEMSRRK